MGYEVDFLAVGGESRCGDAIALRFGNLLSDPPQQVVIVVDGGFTESGKQLVDLIKLRYRTDTVDLVVSTHPDSDHICGLREVLNGLKVGQLAMHLPWEHADRISTWFRDGRVTDASVSENLRRSLEDAYDLHKDAKRRGIEIVEPFQGTFGWGGQFTVLAPSRALYESLLPDFRGTPQAAAPGLPDTLTTLLGLFARAAESLNIETLKDDGGTSAENCSSVVSLLRVEGRAVLLTGDAGIPTLTEAANQLDSLGVDRASISLVQVPHHGSRRNVGPTVLNRILGPIRASDVQERTAFASVACNADATKHPSKRVTNAFRRRGSPVFVTKGINIWHHRDAPGRDDYSALTPIPLFAEVDD